jgi:SAM-dependent methyltransferase
MWSRFNYSSAFTAQAQCHSFTYTVSSQTSARPPTCLVLQASIDIFPSCYRSIPRGNNNFDDRVSDQVQNQTCWSLFDDESFPSAAGAFPMTRLPITLTTSSLGKHVHAVMIQDKVRTSTYASFILTNPILFRDAVVLDVGCGTGSLSLLAAKSGAMHVYAVDASDIVEKAGQIIRANGLENVIR